MLIEHCLSWPDLDGVEHDFEIVFDGDPATGAYDADNACLFTNRLLFEYIENATFNANFEQYNAPSAVDAVCGYVMDEMFGTSYDY